MTSGITSVSAGLLCILATVTAGDPAPRLDLPPGFMARVYARDIAGARDLDLHADGTISVRGDRERYEISPPTAEMPAMVMRVAAGLDDAARGAQATGFSVGAASFVRLDWNARSGELAYVLTPQANTGVPVSPRTLALARSLAGRRHADVALAPDGALFYADSRAGAVWRIERTAL